MLVTLRNTEAWTGDLPIDQVSWPLMASHQFGRCSFTVPRGHAAFAKKYLGDDRGGSYVLIDDDVLGKWEGQVSSVVIDSEGAQVQAMHIAQTASAMIVRSEDEMRACTGAAVVRRAMRFADPDNIFTLGTLVEAAPNLTGYQFGYQTLAAVLDDVSALTGMEWTVAPGAVLSVHPPLGALYNVILSSDGDIYDDQIESSSDDQAAHVIVRNSSLNMNVMAHAPEVGITAPRWSRTAVFDSQEHTRAGMEREALRLIDAYRRPRVTFSVKLRRMSPYLLPDALQAAGNDPVARKLGLSLSALQHWQNIREGSRIVLYMPFAGFDGTHALCRVLERSYSDNQDYLGLTLQYLRPWDAQTPQSVMNSFITSPYIIKQAGSFIGQLLLTTQGFNTNAPLPDSVPDVAVESLSAFKVDGKLVGGQIADDAVGTAQVAPGAITPTELATDAVTTVKIGASQVTTSKVAAGAIDGTLIAAAAVGGTHIAASAVTNTHIASLTILNGNVANNTLLEDKLKLTGQNTVGAAGAASPIPGDPSKWVKIRDDAGNYWVVPAFPVA